jgi:tetratricopeptide (TPR) repeat protein
MKIKTIGIISCGILLHSLACGCGSRKQVTERDRKEASALATEAQFAVSVREWSRAEGLLAKAAQLAPQGDYWLSLGAARIRLNDRAGAKTAYEAAVKEYANEAARQDKLTDPWFKQAFALALLGRKEESRAVIAKAAEKFPNDGKLRTFKEPKEFEKMLLSQGFKDMAL